MPLPTVPFDRDLIASWTLALKAERKSDKTLETYTDGMRYYVNWLLAFEYPMELDKHAFQEYLVWLAETRDYEGNTIVSRHLAVRRFSAWLAEEEDFPDVLIGVKTPKVDQKLIMPLTPEQLQAFFAACKGPNFADRRDEAVGRLMAESGSRATETTRILLSDTNVSAGTTVFRRGKGGKGRIVPFGPQTARAIDRYLRVRRTHKLAGTDALWLGERNRGFGYSALYKTLGARAAAAGIEKFHPHMLRHTFADRWLDKGGSEGGLMAVAGWERSDMVRRYAKGRQVARALDESRRLNLGDL